MIKASITLELRTREVYQLFERRISGDRLFIEAILHKLNIIANRYKQNEHQALAIYQQMQQSIYELTQSFAYELARFEMLLAKKKELAGKQINTIIKYRPTMIVNNPLSMQLFEFIKMYDKLICIVKLLHLAGCFDSNDGYFSNIKRFQKISNKMLSGILLCNQTLSQSCGYITQ